MWGWANLRLAGAQAREMLLTVAARRWGVPPTDCEATDGVVRHAASGRNTAFGELAVEAGALPVPVAPTLRPLRSGGIVGSRRVRVDARSIADGSAMYGVDVRRPGQLYASIERPPTIGGRLLGFDAAAVRRLPGVVDVVQIPEGIAVIATNSWQAMSARSRLDLRWEPGPNAAFDSRDFTAELRQAAGRPGVVTRRDGRGTDDLETLPHRLEAIYEYPFFAHAALEPMNATALVERDAVGERCTLWVPTQTPNGVQSRVAERLGIALDRVEVHVTLSGGGFGRRLHWDYALEAASVARAAPGRPVQVLWTRSDDYRHGYFQSASAHRLVAGWDDSGTPRAWGHRKVSALHNARGGAPTAEELADATYLRDSSWGVYDVPYAIADLQTEYVPRPTHVPIGPWRAVYAPSSIFARECFVDELAAALHIDPIALRLRLLQGPATLTAGDLRIDRARLRRLLEALRERSGWGAALPAGRGRGVACEVYDGDTHVGYVAEVTVEPGPTGRIHVDRLVAVVDAGLVVNPSGAEQQVDSGVAWSLSSLFGGAVEFREGRATAANFNDVPVLRCAGMPAVEAHFLPDDRERPFGLGEPTVSTVVPAVLNAVFAASGRRIRRLPVPNG
jgi:isoquinoline 1-oxidoreductase beta subunit